MTITKSKIRKGVEDATIQKRNRTSYRLPYTSIEAQTPLVRVNPFAGRGEDD